MAQAGVLCVYIVYILMAKILTLEGFTILDGHQMRNALVKLQEISESEHG